MTFSHNRLRVLIEREEWLFVELLWYIKREEILLIVDV